MANFINVPDKENFQPSVETLRKWLSTRKPTLNVGGYQVPGFFSDLNVSADRNWFYIAVLGELIGFIITIYGGFRSGGVFLILAASGIIMFIFCDFFFAVKLHRRKGKITEIKSRQILETDPAQQLALKQQLASGSLTDFFYQLSLILIVIMKIAGIVLLGIFNSLILYFPFIIFYFIVAYVHLNHTGYYFAFMSISRSIEKEYNRFSLGEFRARSFDVPISLKESLNNLPIRQHPHLIVQDPAANNSYIIKVTGVLTDDDIRNLIAGQSDHNKSDLFKACRKIQLENYI